jgi:hypothetical protein
MPRIKPAITLVLALLACAVSVPSASAKAPRMAIGPATALGPARIASRGPHDARNPAKTAKPAASTGKGAMPSNSAVLFADSFDEPDRLVTDDFSHWNPNSPKATPSPDWEMTSGSLYAKGGEAWTESSVFRLNTVRHDFGDVTLSLNVVDRRLFTTSSTPAVAWDGIHLWLRYQSEYSLYAVSFNRRDGHVVVKKKCPGGSENGGTYYELGQGEVAGFPIPFGAVQQVSATARNVAGGVAIALSRNGTQLLTVTDSGLGCAPIASPGAIGVRGDNAEFSFDNLVVAPS